MDFKKTEIFISNLLEDKNIDKKGLSNALKIKEKDILKIRKMFFLYGFEFIEKLSDNLDTSICEILKGECIEKMNKIICDGILILSIPFFQKLYFKRQFRKIIFVISIFFISIILFDYYILKIFLEFLEIRVAL